MPPFIIIDAGLEVREIPKIHVKEPNVEDHSIYFSDESLRIPLSLNGIFSSFPTRRTTTQDLIDGIPVLINPKGPTWNPYSNSYKQNEDSHLHWKGGVIDRQYHAKSLLNESYELFNIGSVIEMFCDVHMSRSSEFGKMESQLISHRLDESLHYNDQNEMPD